MSRLPAFLLATLLLVTPALAQVPWLPPELESSAAAALVARLGEAGIAPPGSDEERMQGALKVLRDLTATIDRWGLEGVVQRAPEFPQIDHPEFADPIVATVAGYGFCSLPLHPELVTTRDEKLTVVLGEYAVMMVSAFLRHRFLADGGTDEDLRALLATDEMNQLSYDIQVDEAKRNYVLAQCGPWFEEMFGEGARRQER
jgi:hypothetical protein